MVSSAVHLPEAIDRDLFKVFDTKSYQTYLFLKSTGIAHTVCNKMKKVICILCNNKHCEGVIKLKASIKASQEASLKEVESEGSTQQIEEAENADKQKLADDLIKPNYHINIPYDPIAKKKSHNSNCKKEITQLTRQWLLLHSSALYSPLQKRRKVQM